MIVRVSSPHIPGRDMARQKRTQTSQTPPQGTDGIPREDLEERVAELSHELSSALVRLKRERTKRNEALRESHEVFQQFFDQNDEALLVFQPDTGEIVDANPAASGLFGYGSTELTEKGLSLFVEAEELHNFNQIVTGPEASDEARILSYVRKNGERRIAAFRVKAIRLRDSDVMVLSFRDISDEIRTKAEARVRQIAVTYSNRMASLGFLLAGVAHEISGLNNRVMYNAQLLSDAWRDALPVLEEHFRQRGDFPLGGPLLTFSEMREAIPKLLPETIESGLKIKRIVEGLANALRDESGLPGRNVDVNRILRYTASTLSDHIQKRTERFALDLAEEVPPVRGDALKLEHLFANLILNALQALPSRNCGILISTHYRKDKNAVEIRIKDEGAGMSKDVLSALAQDSFVGKLEAGGSLGLLVAHMIVREHRGTIEFDSDVGKGTTATVTIPLGDATTSL